MTQEQALNRARRYVELVKRCTTIGSFPIKSENPKKIIIGVSAQCGTFQVIFDEELYSAQLLEICDRRDLAELLDGIN